jgi:hypothetical protein
MMVLDGCCMFSLIDLLSESLLQTLISSVLLTLKRWGKDGYKGRREAITCVCLSYSSSVALLGFISVFQFHHRYSLSLLFVATKIGLDVCRIRLRFARNKYKLASWNFVETSGKNQGKIREFWWQKKVGTLSCDIVIGWMHVSTNAPDVSRGCHIGQKDIFMILLDIIILAQRFLVAISLWQLSILTNYYHMIIFMYKSWLDRSVLFWHARWNDRWPNMGHFMYGVPTCYSKSYEKQLVN